MSARRRVPALALRALCASWSGAAAGAPRVAAALPAAALAAPASTLFPSQSSAFRLGLGARAFASLPAHTELAMPALSPTMAQGNIVSWKKAEGDSIQPGDIYCEVETDKATIEWEAQEEGFLAKILAPAGSKNIEVGTPVAVIVEEEGDVAAFKDYAPSAGGASAAPAAPAAAPAAEPAAAPSGGSFPAHEVMAMPALSPTMTAGNILSWKKAAGDEVAPGDIIAEVETDKATIEWEAQEEGVIAKILVPEGAQGVAVGSPVLVMVDDKDAVPAFESFSIGDAAGGAKPAAKPAAAAAPSAPAAAPAAAAAAPKAPATPKPAVAAAAPGGRVIASPYAKKLAAEAGVSLAGVGGSGPGGRIVAADVHQLVASGGAAPAGIAAAPGAAPSAYTDLEVSQIRRITAERLLESKQQIPHYYLSVSCRLDRLATVRAALNATLAAGAGGKLSVNDFVVKASALALKAVPEVNASWHGDFIRQYAAADCGVAVQTPAGLIVPVVRAAEGKGLSAIAAEVRDLAGRAREGRLRPEEFTGGTFTISNLGMFGVSQFAAIVNPPQACILAVGAAEKKVVPSADGAGFEEAEFMTVTLSCDHRVVDGAVGAAWLKAFKSYIEDPASMLL